MGQNFFVYTNQDKALADRMADALIECEAFERPAQRGAAYARAGLSSEIAETRWEQFAAIDRRALEIHRERRARQHRQGSRIGERVAGVAMVPVMCALVAAASLADQAEAAEVIAKAPKESLAWLLPLIFFAAVIGLLVYLAVTSRGRGPQQ